MTAVNVLIDTLTEVESASKPKMKSGCATWLAPWTHFAQREFRSAVVGCWRFLEKSNTCAARLLQ